MARIAGINIPQNKIVRIGLTYIYGIGEKYSQDPAEFKFNTTVTDIQDLGKQKRIICNVKYSHYFCC